MNKKDLYELLKELCGNNINAMKQNEKIYIQALDNIEDENTFKRETDSLLKINDAYPKLLIANTKLDTYQYVEIKVMDISKRLEG